MRLGKRERAAKRERLAIEAAIMARNARVSGPAIATSQIYGFEQWPVSRRGRPGWGLSGGTRALPCRDENGRSVDYAYWKGIRRVA